MVLVFFLSLKPVQKYPRDCGSQCDALSLFIYLNFYYPGLTVGREEDLLYSESELLNDKPEPPLAVGLNCLYVMNSFL